MDEKAVRTFGIVGIGMICGAIAACAGGDTPALDEDTTNKIASVYAGGAGPVATAGTGGKAATGAGGSKATGTAGKAATGTGGTASTSTAGTGGGASTGAVGSGTVAGGSDSGGGADCDGFGVLSKNCGGSSCHGGAVTPFATSEDAAKGYIGKNGTISCGSAGPLINPDNPGASIIVQKAEGTANCGGPMPPGGPKLSDADIQCVEDWIGSLK